MEPKIRPVIANVFRPLPAHITPISLSKLMRRVRLEGVRVNSRICWLWVEIAEIRDTDRHIYFTLVQHRDDGALIARTKGMIWEVRKTALLDKFRSEANLSLHVGMKVLAEVRCRFDVRHGFALEVLDFHPSHAPGTIAVRMKALRDRLHTEGRWDKNRLLAMPDHIGRMAIVAPADSAGLDDFESSLRALQQVGALTIDVFPSRFQGRETVEAIRQAFAHLLQAHRQLPFDLVLMLRGGGSVTDLHWLNVYSLARCVTDCPIPVWTGIGHERDQTILDEVAHSVFGTPSKAAAAVVEVTLRRALPKRACPPSQRRPS